MVDTVPRPAPSHGSDLPHARSGPARPYLAHASVPKKEVKLLRTDRHELPPTMAVRRIHPFLRREEDAPGIEDGSLDWTLRLEPPKITWASEFAVNHVERLYRDEYLKSRLEFRAAVLGAVSLMGFGLTFALAAVARGPFQGRGRLFFAGMVIGALLILHTAVARKRGFPVVVTEAVSVVCILFLMACTQMPDELLLGPVAIPIGTRLQDPSCLEFTISINFAFWLTCVGTLLPFDQKAYSVVAATAVALVAVNAIESLGGALSSDACNVRRLLYAVAFAVTVFLVRGTVMRIRTSAVVVSPLGPLHRAGVPGTARASHRAADQAGVVGGCQDSAGAPCSRGHA